MPTGLANFEKLGLKWVIRHSGWFYSFILEIVLKLIIAFIWHYKFSLDYTLNVLLAVLLGNSFKPVPDLQVHNFL